MNSNVKHGLIEGDAWRYSCICNSVIHLQDIGKLPLDP